MGYRLLNGKLKPVHHLMVQIRGIDRCGFRHVKSACPLLLSFYLFNLTGQQPVGAVHELNHIYVLRHRFSKNEWCSMLARGWSYRGGPPAEEKKVDCVGFVIKSIVGYGIRPPKRPRGCERCDLECFPCCSFRMMRLVFPTALADDNSMLGRLV